MIAGAWMLFPVIVVIAWPIPKPGKVPDFSTSRVGCSGILGSRMPAGSPKASGGPGSGSCKAKSRENAAVVPGVCWYLWRGFLRSVPSTIMMKNVGTCWDILWMDGIIIVDGWDWPLALLLCGHVSKCTEALEVNRINWCYSPIDHSDFWDQQFLLVGGWATPLKNISQLGWLFPIYGKIKNVPNHQPVCLLLVGRLIQNFGNLVSKPERTEWRAWFCSVVLSSSSSKAAGASGSHPSRTSRPASGTSLWDHQPSPGRWFHPCPCASSLSHQFHCPGSGSFQPRSRSQLQPSFRRHESPDHPPQPQFPQPQPRSQAPHPPQPPQPPPLFQLQSLHLQGDLQRSQPSQLSQPQLCLDHPWFPQSLVSAASALEASSLWLGLRTLLGMSSSGGLSQATSGRVQAEPFQWASHQVDQTYGCVWNGLPPQLMVNHSLSSSFS